MRFVSVLSWVSLCVTPEGADKHDPPRTRTWNLRLRRPTPYPLGQRADGAPSHARAIWHLRSGCEAGHLRSQGSVSTATTNREARVRLVQQILTGPTSSCSSGVVIHLRSRCLRGACLPSISGLVVEYIVAIDVTRVRFPADANCSGTRAWLCPTQHLRSPIGQRSGAVVSVLGS